MHAFVDLCTYVGIRVTRPTFKSVCFKFGVWGSWHQGTISKMLSFLVLIKNLPMGWCVGWVVVVVGWLIEMVDPTLLVHFNRDSGISSYGLVQTNRFDVLLFMYFGCRIHTGRRFSSLKLDLMIITLISVYGAGYSTVKEILWLVMWVTS